MPFFLARAAFYFAVWIAIAYFVNRWSLEQDRAGSPALTRRLQLLSAGGLVAYGLTMTFASIDWVMSLEPHWFSTMYGVLYIAGQALNALAFVTAALVLMSGEKPFSGFVRPAHYHDLGKLLLAFVMFWSYVSFAQYLIIWAGNLPEEIPWYLRRLHGGWGWLGAALDPPPLRAPVPAPAAGGGQPQLAGSSSPSRGSSSSCASWTSTGWCVPSSRRPRASAASARFQSTGSISPPPIGIGGVWLAVFLWQLEERPLLPVNDPEFVEALAHADH